MRISINRVYLFSLRILGHIMKPAVLLVTYCHIRYHCEIRDKKSTTASFRNDQLN